MGTPLTDRQQAILRALVREHVKTALPVGSATLVETHGFNLSPATIRNEFTELERQAYMTHPHTSAGRVPTEKGYRFLVSDLLTRKDALRKPARKTPRATLPDDPDDAIKTIAKHLAAHAQNAVVVGFGPRHVYYTGLSYLFAQPEFRELARVMRFSEIIDRLDEVMTAISDRVSGDIVIWLGRENPFGSQCGTLLTRYGSGSRIGVIGLLGPMRMDYERNYALIALAKQMLEEMHYE